MKEIYCAQSANKKPASVHRINCPPGDQFLQTTGLDFGEVLSGFKELVHLGRPVAASACWMCMLTRQNHGYLCLKCNLQAAIFPLLQGVLSQFPSVRFWSERSRTPTVSFAYPHTLVTVAFGHPAWLQRGVSAVRVVRWVEFELCSGDACL